MKTTIKKWIAQLALAAIGALESVFVPQIKNDVVRAAIVTNLLPIKNTAFALSDEEPRDEEQVLVIWKTHLNTALPDFAEDQITAAVAKIEDPNIRAVLSTLGHPVTDLLRVVSDDNPNNTAQVREMFKEFVTNPGVQSVLLENVIIPLIEVRVQNEFVKKFLIETLRNGVVIGDGNGLV